MDGYRRRDRSEAGKERRRADIGKEERSEGNEIRNGMNKDKETEERRRLVI
jgi:hypothetical protein